MTLIFIQLFEVALKLTPCSTSPASTTELGLQAMALFSLLSSLFSDLRRVVIGDLGSSSEYLIAGHGDEEVGASSQSVSANCLGISITSISFALSAVAGEDEWPSGCGAGGDPPVLT